jgi:hypothetical protein
MARRWTKATDASRPCRRLLVDCKVRLFLFLEELYKRSLTLLGIFLADAIPIRLQHRDGNDQPRMRLPLKIRKLFGWLLDQHLIACVAKVVLLIGAHSARRYTRVRPHASPFVTEGQPSIFRNDVDGFTEYSDSVIVRVAIVAHQAVSQW